MTLSETQKLSTGLAFPVFGMSSLGALNKTKLIVRPCGETR